MRALSASIAPSVASPRRPAICTSSAFVRGGPPRGPAPAAVSAPCCGPGGRSACRAEVRSRVMMPDFDFAMRMASSTRSFSRKESSTPILLRNSTSSSKICGVILG
eukprot:5265764-Alexandrium_andersonii.AAC.1